MPYTHPSQIYTEKLISKSCVISQYIVLVYGSKGIPEFVHRLKIPYVSFYISFYISFSGVFHCQVTSMDENSTKRDYLILILINLLSSTATIM
jgi:hypothetical protein